MQVMREKTQGVFAIIVAVFIAVSFALWGVQNYLHADGGNAVLAKVNGKKITRAQLEVAYEQFKHSEMFKFGGDALFDQKTQDQFKKIILEQLVKTEVSHQAMAKMGLNIGQEQLWADITRMPIFQADGKFSLEYFKVLTQKVFSSQAAFFKEVKNSLLSEQLQKSIKASNFVLPNEIKQVEQLFKQQRDFNYFIINPAIFAAEIVIKDAQIKDYYDKHQDEFTTPEKVSLQYIELSSDAFKQQVNPTAEQLQQYYHNHISAFTKPKKWQITQAVLPLNEAAKKELEQIKTATDWSKITNAKINTIWITKSELGGDLALQLDQLGVGQVSKPFKVKDGIAIGKILAIAEGEVDAYQKVAARVKAELEREQLAQIFSEANDKLADLAYMNSDSLAVAAKEFSLPIQATDLIARDNNGTGILGNKKIVQAAFSDAVLKHGYNSNPIEIAPGKLVVLRLKEHVPQAVKSLDVVKNDIILKLKTAAMHQKAGEFSQKLLAELRQGKSLAEAGKPYNFTWQVKTHVKHDDVGINKKLTEAVFALSQPSGAKSEFVLSALHDGYAIAQLTKVYDANMPLEEAQKTAGFVKSLPEQLGQFEYKLLTEEWAKKAKIVIK